MELRSGGGRVLGGGGWEGYWWGHLGEGGLVVFTYCGFEEVPFSDLEKLSRLAADCRMVELPG